MSEPSKQRTDCPSDREIEEFLDTRPPNVGLGRENGSWLTAHLADCRRCQGRVVEIQGGNKLLAELAAAQQTAAGERPQSGAATNLEIPGYEIHSEIHRGGQGIVFRAIQTATKRTVALKVLLQGAFASVRQQRRFEREIDLVAGLRHPNVVTIYDSGVAPDGCHYFAMEYIEGQPLNQFMRARHGSKSADDKHAVNETLRLFAKICEAVGYAHQRGIIHRDLKPGNICIDEKGEPHVLDFGLAKDVDVDESIRVTRSGEFMGTLAYASPEQTKGDSGLIDVRTDVYALGVILYEMLTNHLPYQIGGTLADALRAIAEDEPERPSTWYRQFTTEQSRDAYAPYKVNDEIETIVLKALAKESGRRYQTAEHLKQDVERYLAGEPIDAKRDSTWYVFQKSVRRYKTPVSVAATFVIGICVALAYVLSQNAVIAAERDNVLYERDNFRTVKDDYNALLQWTDPHQGSKTRMIDVLTAKSDQMLSNPPDYRPDAMAELHEGYGAALKAYEEFDRAQRHLEEACAIRREVSPEPNLQLARDLYHLATVYLRKSEVPKAEAMYVEALEICRAFPESPLDIARGLFNLALTHRIQGQLTRARDGYQEALDLYLESGAGEEVELQMSYRMNLATCLTEMDQLEDAERLYRESLAIHKRHAKGDQVPTARVQTAMARCLTKQGKFDEAASLLDSALTVKRAQLNPSARTVGITLQYRAELNYARGDSAAAESDCREALEIFEQVWPDGHRRIAEVKMLSGMILLEADDAESAEPILREAVLMMRQTSEEPDHYLISQAESVLGACLTQLGRFEEAEPLLLKSRPRLREVLGDNHLEARAALDRIVNLYDAWGKPEKAAAYRL